MANSCKACDDPGPKPSDLSGRENMPDNVREVFDTHCTECAAEIIHGKIPSVGTMMHGSGGGRRVIYSPKPFS